MIIKKMYQGSLPENKILNTRTDSQTDTYSCDYINNISASGGVDLSDYYTKTETDTVIDEKIEAIPETDLSNYYNKEEIDNLIENIPSSGDGESETTDCLPIGTIVEYEGDTIPEGYEEVIDENEYSVDEQVVGTWIDGLPFYRKVITISNLAVANETAYAHGIANIKEILPMTCGRMLYGNNTPYYNYPLVAKSGAVLTATYNPTYITWYGNDSWGTTHTHIFIIYYTKTTD